jgi:hypothetical protein
MRLPQINTKLRIQEILRSSLKILGNQNVQDDALVAHIRACLNYLSFLLVYYFLKGKKYN